ncbi:MAG: hypothetical protein HY618_07245 [Candidatus Tectomicrobia bacterium]|uniref:Uncharacterized protein n=1 Tax=Tectimicrobiota bacterium TaxID=2528274 RepID=A0A932ZVE0_UNCTE|nr:hypothetical protein [Candidatus Tectomicrobia bacterium]
MQFLDRHKAVDVEKKPGRDPLERSKEKLIAALEGQIAWLRNPRQRTGRFRPWWFRHTDGHLYTHLRFGTRPLEFPDGKAFPVSSMEELIPFYEEAGKAVRAGEFDEIILKARGVGGRRRGGEGRRRGGGRRSHPSGMDR